jgi:predicted amidohydrolase YtcJ
VWHAVARVDRATGDVVGPAQRLSREAALRAATIEGVWLIFQEREQGSIEPGKRADFVVLSEDPLTVPEERLPGIVADLAVAGGRVDYERAGG